MEKVNLKINDTDLIIETGKFAKQADGAVSVTFGDTMILATVVASRKTPDDEYDFFPLSVNYVEKTYAAGKIPGGFFKREGKLSEKEIMTSRLIDRPIRPLFPKGFFYEMQITVTTLSADQVNPADVISIIGSSAALCISDIPFEGPIGAVRVGRVNNNLTVNPNFEQQAQSDINLMVAGTRKGILMVEGSAKEVTEADMVSALKFAHKYIIEIIKLQDELVAKVKPKKREIKIKEIDKELEKSIRAQFFERYKKALSIVEKRERGLALDKITEESIKPEYDGGKKVQVGMIFEDMEREILRDCIMNENKRMDGRGFDDIRNISCEVGILPRAHGSALFTRGQTQSLAVTTLGTIEDEQKIDNIDGETTKGFMLHYNFPPYSVGEVGKIGPTGRREVGHGMLAERSLQHIMPPYEKFPYTVRIVSEILESNGSSSMATVCSGCLSLLNAGVPVKASVAGIAMGLIKEKEKVAILTDIIGMEDHHGDMDFKVAGTSEGITGFQMDIKIQELTFDIIEKALEKAKKARLFILDKMNSVLSKPHSELSQFAPRIITMSVPKDKIGTVIGPGGKMIRSIIEETGATINIDDEGIVTISAVGQEASKLACQRVTDLVAEVEIGKVYDGKVIKIMDFGAFVEVLPGKEGLVHISQLALQRVNRVRDVVNEGDKIQVKVMEIDRMGRINLSHKEVLLDQENK